MKITCLCENTAYCDTFGAEHGLSLFIETNGRTILFDMGQTELFAENAARLDVDLSAVDTAVLSHGHYDHGGGVKRFLELNKTAPVYLSRYAFGERYDGVGKYIGLDTTLADEKRLVFTDGEMALGDGITLTDKRDGEKLYDLGSFGLNMVEDGVAVPDDFRHEQYMLCEEKGKRVLFSGCSHRGVLDIVRWFKPDVLVGGFHFSKIPTGDELARYAAVLDGYDTAYITCHCTGLEQFAFMKERMRSLSYISAGEVIEWE
ncbi:MAG: MBL fold metallo-hydrolase [Ruminococcaceae bacterium]|nr:MBL fold metallo-hydrolase [Oscillospiraceae bacterium]